jgi:hypothetical protein
MKLPWAIKAEEERIAREKRRKEEYDNAPKVRDMEEGDWGYILPWEFDYAVNMVISPKSVVIYENPAGTRSLFIKKLANGTFHYEH